MKKRSDYISWAESHMSMAVVAARRSKEPVCQNGATIIDPSTNHVKSIGYTGMPVGCSDDVFPWGDENPEDKINSKHSYVVHAELNCILNAESVIDGCTMYFFSEKGFPPCSECAKAIVQKGIKKVICCVITSSPSSTNFDWGPTKKMFAAAGVSLEEMPSISFLRKVGIDFLKIYEKARTIKASKENLFGEIPSEDHIGPFVDQYRYLSNFHVCPVPFGGRIWKSSEHAYQAQKAVNESDAERIFNAPEPKDTKRIGGEIQIREDWDIVKDGIMYDIVRNKFMYNNNLALLLCSTGQTKLIESNWWKDRYWGTDMDLNGLNKLGKILMLVRKELQGKNKE